MASFGSTTPCEEVIKTFPDQIKGRIFLVTGTSAKGLGANAAIALARGAPSQIVLVSRNHSKVEPVMQEIASIDPEIKTTFVACELSDFDSVRQAAEQIRSDASIPHVDVVINNAGVMAIRDFTLDKQGYEMTLSSNHLGHFLLTNLIMPKILAAGPGARIVNMTSRGHRIEQFRFDDYNFSDGAAYERWSAYARSKTANILFTVELARRLAGRGVRSYAVHPGGIWGTGLALHLEMKDFDEIAGIARRNNGRDTFVLDAGKTLSQGTSTMLRAALDPSLDDKSGSFMEDCQVEEPLDYATDPEKARKLWTLSEKLVGQQFEL